MGLKNELRVIVFDFMILSLVMLATGLVVWIIAANHYQKITNELKEENFKLKSQVDFSHNFINELKLEFGQIAKDALGSQQETLLSLHSNDLKTKIDLFKAEEITPINNLLKEFKTAIDEYQKKHATDTQEVKNAIATAEKYAKALTTDQNTKGSLGEDLLEQVLNYSHLQENVHYSKQFNTENGKPDFIVHLGNNKHVIIDSKVILKKYLEYREFDSNENLKQEFINDITLCINNLAKRHYEDIETIAQPGFILMYIPVESCVNLIYSDTDFRKVVELANSKNIIIIGTASLIVVLRLINQLWASRVQEMNVNNIISCGEKLYNNITSHAQSLINIRSSIEKTAETVQKEINRFTARNNGSIFKEAEKLKEYGILAKQNSNKGTVVIPDEFLQSEIQPTGEIND